MAGTASVSDAGAGNAAIRPFRVAIPDAAITAMKRRIAETRWADAEPVPNDGQGVRRLVEETRPEVVRRLSRDCRPEFATSAGLSYMKEAYPEALGR